MATQTKTSFVTLGSYEIGVHTEIGAIASLRREGGPQCVGHVEPVVSLLADVQWKPLTDAPVYRGHVVEGDTLSIQVKVGPLTLFDQYRVVGELLERRVLVRNSSQEEVQLTGVRMALGGIAVGDPAQCLFEAPGNTIRARAPLSVAASQPVKPLVLKAQYAEPPETMFAPGARVRWNRAFADAPDVAPGLLIVHNPQVRWSLITWYFSNTEPGTPWTTGDGVHATLGFDSWLAGWMAPGAELVAGVQYIVLHQGDYASALALYRSYFQHTGVLPPIYGRVDNATDWSGVYEAHPGQYGGFRGFTAFLPKLSELGIDTIYLLPVMLHENKTGQPWDGNWDDIGSPYAMHDFSVLEPSLGSEKEFREMIDTAHDLGMRVLMDFVAQGCSVDSHYVQDKPQWFARDEKGKMLHSHGWDDTWSIDWANADYHNYMLEWATRYARECKVDGYRVDAPHGKEPNWARGLPYHASYTGLGATPLLEALRRRLMAIRPSTAMYCELFGPLWIRSHDISNDYHPYAMAYEMFHQTLLPRDFNEYLRDYWAVMPQAEDGSPSPRICFTETHDTRYWPATHLRGSAISQCLLAILVMAGFVPMLWAGQEKGQEAFIKGLLLARRENAAIRRGKYLFNQVWIDPARTYPRNTGSIPQDWVYTLIRHNASSVLFGVASLFPSKVTYGFGLPLDKLPPIDPAKTYRLRDLITYQPFSEYGKETWTGVELANFSLTPEMLTPYIFRIEEAEG